jgi:3-hydroxyacyl-[acyl-carrier-protein] dehydratase
MRLEYFQLIDRIVALDLVGRTITAQARVPETSTVFEGHFPGHPLMPGVLLIESMAQTSGWLIIGITGFTRMPFLAAVKEAKLRTFVSPGQMLSLQASLLHDGSGYAITKAAIDVDGKTVADAEITFRVMAFPDPKFRTSMGEVAQRIGFPVEASGHG